MDFHTTKEVDDNISVTLDFIGRHSQLCAVNRLLLCHRTMEYIR